VSRYDVAVELAGEGIPIFPCNPDKTPRTLSGFKDATTNFEQIDKWFLDSDALIGVPTGKQFFVVDIDPKGEDWYTQNQARLDCACINKTRRGWHLAYAAPVGATIKCSASRLAPGVDVRGDGGYVIWWPGEGLATTGTINDIGPAPDWLLQELTAKTNGHDRAERQHDHDDHIAEGKRNQALTRLAGKLVRDGLSLAALTAALRAENAKRCSPPLPDAEVEAIAASIARYAPAEEVDIDFASIAVPTLAELVAAKVAPRTWFVDQIIPAGAFLIVGRPKVGKSWLLLQLALAAARGEPFLGYNTLSATGVLYIAAEDDAARIQERFAIIGQGAPPANLHVMVSDQFRALASKYAHVPLADFFGNYLAAHPAIKVMILDTEATCRAIWAGEAKAGRATDIKAKDYGETREFDVIALRERAFIGLVNHASKRKSGGYIDVHELVNRTNVALAGASGSIVLADPPNCHVDDGGDEASKIRLLGIRGRDLRDDVLVAVKQAENASFANLGNWSTFSATAVEQDLWEAALAIHRESRDYIKARDLADAVGKQPGTVQRAISRMLKAGRHTWQGYRMETTPSKGFKLVSVYGELP
jgi:hypothetical protein